jgi:hypothetical protein
MHKLKNYTIPRDLLLIMAAVSGFLVLAGHTVSAQSAESTQSALAVSPAITEQVLTPSQKTQSTIRVTNITHIPLPIKASVKNLILQESMLPAADKAVYDASAWFTVDPADFILQPGQTKDISITILPPGAATPGGHYATVYFQPLIPTEALSPNTAYLSARVGVLAFLIVKGDITEQASLAKLSVPRLQQFGPVGVKVPVTNSGNVHLFPQGRLIIRDYHGKQLSSLPLSTGLILPKTVKTYELQWNNRGKIGYFTAQAELTYGTDKQSLRSAKIGFWVLPWLPVVITVVLIATMTWFVIRTRHRWSAAWKVLRGRNDSA